MLEMTPEGRVCGFCGIVGGPRSKFAGGYGAMICADCVHRYHHILESEAESRAIQRAPWEEMTKQELLETFVLVVGTAEQSAAFVRDWVNLMRMRRVSWADIGNVLGMTRQGAWERFARSRTKDEQPGNDVAS